MIMGPMIIVRALKSLVLALAAFTLVAGTAFAQPYPSKPVKLIVTYPASGSSDLRGWTASESPLSSSLSPSRGSRW